MHLKRLLFLIFISINFYTYSQQQKDFTGYWVYESLVLNNNRDSLKSQLVENLYSDLYIHFKNNGQYSSLILNRNEQGQWTYNNYNIELRSHAGAIIEIKIIEVNKQDLILEFANETFCLKRRNNFPYSVSETEIKTSKPKKKKRKRNKKFKE